MPLPLTSEERVTSSSSRGIEKTATDADRGTENRYPGSRQPMQQEEPYSSHAGPLMQMTQAVQRARAESMTQAVQRARAERIATAKRQESTMDRLERELRKREGII